MNALAYTLGFVAMLVVALAATRRFIPVPAGVVLAAGAAKALAALLSLTDALDAADGILEG